MHDIRFESGLYYGDASGGTFTFYPTLRGCGIGLIRIIDNACDWSANFNLPGPLKSLDSFSADVIQKNVQKHN